jgi:ABC-2 type transport system permease protein
VTNASLSENGTLPTSVLAEVLDTYQHTRAAVEKVVATRPELLTTGEAIGAFTESAVQTVRLSATKNPPSPDARYYYALLAMAAGMGATAAMESVRRLLPTAGPLGARQTLAAVPRWRMLVGALLGAWLCEFACLLVAALFMWGVAGVSFGNDASGVVVALAASSLMACAAGALCGTVPRMETGMISGITCLLSLFTGLYGTSSQQLADSIEAAAPALAHANPLWQTTNSFYALLYYDTPDAFLESVFALLIMALAFLALASFRMRRTSYDHL